MRKKEPVYFSQDKISKLFSEEKRITPLLIIEQVPFCAGIITKVGLKNIGIIRTPSF